MRRTRAYLATHRRNLAFQRLFKSFAIQCAGQGIVARLGANAIKLLVELCNLGLGLYCMLSHGAQHSSRTYLGFPMPCCALHPRLL